MYARHKLAFLKKESGSIELERGKERQRRACLARRRPEVMRQDLIEEALGFRSFGGQFFPHPSQCGGRVGMTIAKSSNQSKQVKNTKSR